MLLRILLIINYSLLIKVLSAQPTHEFRGVWIASVDNIDWPLKGMVNVDSQKAEYIRQLDMHRANGMNAVIVQVRPAADAFYPSPYEPWSQWLTGTQGKPPSPFYDPLEFMITEAHNRGMVFHAWLNPYRADFKIGASSIGPSHITKIHPDWFLEYGDKKYFDPASKEVQRFVVNVVADIVNRYDVDAIHMDDYFYPYRITGKEFPDSISYLNSKSRLNKEDWRRSNVDSIIKQISIAIKKEKSWVQFGISPFSVWRNKDKDPRGSDSQAGQTNYDDLYADILLWLKEKWVDYVAPQLYLEIGHAKIDYVKLLKWWSENSYGRHLYIGHGIYRANGNSPTNAAWRKPDELPNQIKLLRQYSNVHGSIYFSSKSFNNNPNGWNDSLRNNYYKNESLIPSMEWLDNTEIKSPEIRIDDSCCGSWAGQELRIEVKNNESNAQIRGFAVYGSLPNDFSNKVLLFVMHPCGKPIGLNDIDLNSKNSKLTISDFPAFALSRFGNKEIVISVTAFGKTFKESNSSNQIKLIYKKYWKISE